MRKPKEIKQALYEMEVRRSAAILDLCEYRPNGVKYDTEIIRNMETTDAVIRTLMWVLNKQQNAQECDATKAK